MNKKEMTTNQLQELIIEANLNTNMVAYGDYRPYHDFIGLDGYGNLESMTKEEYKQELIYYFEEYSEEV